MHLLKCRALEELPRMQTAHPVQSRG
jgi:hypothetical protein